MTDPRNRQYGRAVRAYQRSHPGTSLDEARQAVTRRAAQNAAPRERIPAAPRPESAETLPEYIQRVSSALGVHRHRAMELLGLEPGASATRRLDELTRVPLPDDTARALCTATGMTSAQARALCAPRAARPDVEAVRGMAEENFVVGRFSRGGEGKTSSAPGDLATALALTFARRAHMIKDAPGELDRTAPVVVDLPWPSDRSPLPVDPALGNKILKEFGPITPNPQSE
ncbi:hypothetical protein ACVWZD_000414 [Streptomyces sp. TE3672]